LASELAENDFFRFSIVRNPWDRLVSAWRNKIVREESKKSPEFLRKLNSTASQEELSSARENFPLFVRLLADSQLFAKNIHFMPQTAILAGVELDYMGRFERYAGDIEHVLSVVGLSRLMPSLPHLNSTNNRKHYGQYYDRESRDIVGDLFQADVIKWGYSFKTEE
jgi:chondroitin 4-sulfotransferase 11